MSLPVVELSYEIEYYPGNIIRKKTKIVAQLHKQRPSKDVRKMSRPCYQYNSAIVRNPSASVVSGLRTNHNGDPDYYSLKLEHETYVTALESLGIEVTVLPELEDFPDSVFVEDPALVFTEGAILLRSGAASRQGRNE